MAGTEGWGSATISSVSDTASNTYSSAYVGDGSSGLAGYAYATAGTTATITVTVAFSSGTPFNGIVVQVWRGSDGIGAIASSAPAGGAAPSVNMTTTQDNSAVVFVCADWNAATATPVYRTGFGAATEAAAYQGDSTHWGARVVYHADAGAASTQAYGIASGSGSSSWTLTGIEVKGSAGGAATFVAPNFADAVASGGVSEMFGQTPYVPQPFTGAVPINRRRP